MSVMLSLFQDKGTHFWSLKIEVKPCYHSLDISLKINCQNEQQPPCWKKVHDHKIVLLDSSPLPHKTNYNKPIATQGRKLEQTLERLANSYSCFCSGVPDYTSFR